MDEVTAFRMGEGFGLGMGDMSQTCGAITGAVACMGLLNSAGDLDAPNTTKRATMGLASTPDRTLFGGARQLHLPGTEGQDRLPGRPLRYLHCRLRGLCGGGAEKPRMTYYDQNALKLCHAFWREQLRPA